MIKHDLTHHYQPTNYSCAQAALAMLLSHYGLSMNPEEIIASIPVNKNPDGSEMGTINQHLASWCLSQDFDVTIHSADFQILDLSWQDLPKEKLLERMRASLGHHFVPSTGKEWSETYLQSYIDFVEADGKLRIHPYLSQDLLDKVIKDQPFLPAVSSSVLYNEGRSRHIGLHESEADDMDGIIGTHSIVVYGKDAAGNYLVADPWRKPGRHAIEPERLLAAMAAAQIECDNLLFYINKK